MSLHSLAFRPAKVWLTASAVLAGALLITTTGCSSKATGTAPTAMPVTTAPVLVQSVPLTHEYVGQLSAKENVDLRARVSGFLQRINFQEGSHVRAGQVLFQIEQESYKATLASTEAQLARDKASLSKADKDVTRLKPLVAGHAAPEQDLDAALAQQAAYQAAIKADEAAIAEAKLNLGYTVIRSPIDGVIGKLAVTRGNLVGKGDNTLLATVSSYTPIYVYFSVPEGVATDFVRKHVQSKHKTAQVELQLSDGSTFEHKGTVDFADRAVDTNTGTLTMRAVFPNPQGLLRPGQFARVTVGGEQVTNAVLVPQKAVADMLNMKVVMTVNSQNVVSMQPVVIGGEYRDQFIVTSGLKGGENIIIEGLQKARPGAKVIPMPASASKGR